MDIVDIIDKAIINYYIDSDDNIIDEKLAEQIENIEEFNQNKDKWLKKIRAKMEELNSKQTEK